MRVKACFIDLMRLYQLRTSIRLQSMYKPRNFKGSIETGIDLIMKNTNNNCIVYTTNDIVSFLFIKGMHHVRHPINFSRTKWICEDKFVGVSPIANLCKSIYAV